MHRILSTQHTYTASHPGAHPQAEGATGKWADPLRVSPHLPRSAPPPVWGCNWAVKAQVPRPEIKLASPGNCSARLGSPEPRARLGTPGPEPHRGSRVGALHSARSPASQ
ncbi:hypothetical protein NN561_003312 [Cricetulus griseus]